MNFYQLPKLLGTVLLCLGWPALVGGLSLGGVSMGFYVWFILVFFGWWVYLPVLGLHWLALRCLRQPTVGHSLGAGMLLAVLVPGALMMINEYNLNFPVPTIPNFSLARTLDLVNFAIAGALYGLLYWGWVRQDKAALVAR